MGKLTGYDDGTTSAVYTYDTLYRKTAETINYGAFSLENGYTYYANGLKKTYTGPDAIPYGYLYDANNQLAAVQIPNAGYITVSGYNWNLPASMMLPGGTTKQFTYDPMMRTTGIDVADPGQNEVLNYAYTHDRMDNIVTKDTEHGNYSYTYDDLYRLTDADNPVQSDEAFTYDNVGNRLTAADSATEWAYNENNELTGHDDVTYDYDLNGNMIEKNAGGVITKFFYNVEDRLERVEDGSGNVIASYYYDPFGRRLWKDVSGTRTCFHYSDEGLVGEYDATGSVIKTYGWKPGSTWSTDPLFMKIGSEYYYYHNDHLGTPQKMTSVSGAVVWSAKYSSFGDAFIEVESVVNNLRFPGQYWDGESGLHYNYKRYYDIDAKRYLNIDPLRISQIKLLYQNAVNNLFRSFPPYLNTKIDVLLTLSFLYHYSSIFPQMNHNYSFVRNSPNMLIDPKGEIPFLIMGIGAVAGGVSNYYAMKDSLSGWDLAESVIFGAGLGALGAFVPGGVLGGTFAGGTFSLVNNLNNQLLSKECIDLSDAGRSFKQGLWGGFLGGAGTRIGKNFVSSNRNVNTILTTNQRSVHPYDLTGKGIPSTDYSTLGGAAGIVAGSFPQER